MKPEPQDYQDAQIADGTYQRDLAMWEVGKMCEEYDNAMAVAAHLSEESQVYNLAIEK